MADFDGLHTRSLRIWFGSDLYQGRIEYIVNIFGQASVPNDFELGSLTNSSEHISTQLITRANLSFGSEFTYVLDAHTFDYAKLTDLSNGTGARVYYANEYNGRLHLVFEPFGALSYMLDVYGTPANSSGITVGELHPGSIALASDIVSEFGTHSTFVRRTSYPIDRIEVINRETRSSVRASLLVGEVGGNTVVVLFEADEPSFIHFSVNLFGRIE